MFLKSNGFKLIVNRRSLEDIGKRSRMLSEKGKVTKFLDKKRDSGVIVRLVEQLRQAILIYQVSTAEGCRSSRVEAFWIAIATTRYRQPGHTIGCEFPTVSSPSSELMGDHSMQSSFSAFSKRREVQQPTESVSSLLTYFTGSNGNK